MTDIVERLRTLAMWDTMESEYNTEDHIAWKAADEIERLRAALALEKTND